MDSVERYVYDGSGGDFNSILYASKKKWGSLRSIGVCGSFSRWFHSNKLYDLSFNGQRFTWSRGSLFKRIDRVVYNEDWFPKFINSTVLHLPKLSSDYHHVLVHFDKVERLISCYKPFCFIAV